MLALPNQTKMALEWDLTQPIRFLTERKGLPDRHVNEMAVEYRRFIGVIAAFPKEMFPVSEAVDEMWHTHILFTSDYRVMGQAVRGEYINHHPILSEEERQKVLPYYTEGTLRRYVQLYGEPSPEWWPVSGAICWSKGPGLLPSRTKEGSCLARDRTLKVNFKK